MFIGGHEITGSQVDALSPVKSADPVPRNALTAPLMSLRIAESLFDETISARDLDFTDPTPQLLDMMQGETSPDGPMRKVPLAQAKKQAARSGNYWTLFTTPIWKVLHAVLHSRCKTIFR
ncbi:MAG: hypothetical protein ABI257_04865 [Nitrosospira sp.]